MESFRDSAKACSSRTGRHPLLWSTFAGHSSGAPEKHSAPKGLSGSGNQVVEDADGAVVVCGSRTGTGEGSGEVLTIGIVSDVESTTVGLGSVADGIMLLEVAGALDVGSEVSSAVVLEQAEMHKDPRATKERR